MRDQNLAAVRFIAIVLMVLTHAAGPGFYSFGPHWNVIVAYEAIAHTAVPLFFMISGALLVSREEPVFTFYRKRYARIFPSLVFWSLLYIPVVSRWPDAPAHLTPISILHGPVSFHLWFVYTIASLYLLMPLLTAFYVRASQSLKIVAIVLAGLSQIYDPFFVGVLHVNFGVDLHLLPQYTVYLLAGAYVYEHKPRISKSKTVIALIATLSMLFWVGTFILIRHDSIQHDAPREFFMNYNSLNITVFAVTVFALLIAIPLKRVPWVITDVADRSFGIYLVHWFFLGAWLFGSFGFFFKWDTFNPIVSVPMVAATGIVLSYAVCFFLSKVPIFRRFV